MSVTIDGIEIPGLYDSPTAELRKQPARERFITMPKTLVEKMESMRTNPEIRKANWDLAEAATRKRLDKIFDLFQTKNMVEHLHECGDLFADTLFSFFASMGLGVMGGVAMSRQQMEENICGTLDALKRDLLRKLDLLEKASARFGG